jgi:hypothetical protein
MKQLLFSVPFHQHSMGKKRNLFKNKKAGSTFLMSILLCFALMPVAFGQVITGDIIGSVSDPSGAAVPGASVTVTNTGTQFTRKTETNATGDYTFNLLPTGTYSLSIEAKGFKAHKLGEVPLSSGQRARVDAKLEVGNLTEIVEVSGTAPLLQTDSSTVGSLVTEKSVTDLPLNGRNFINLVTLQSGVNEGTPGNITTGARPDERRQTSSYSANGQRENLNNQMLDGMDNNERYYGLMGIRPSIDGISEVRVETNAFTAEASRSAGAIVNVITKSGTNNFHGTLFEFIRNDKLDANEFFNNVAQKPKPKYRQNQFGGSIGGPIFKNKTFFFFDIEQYQIRQGTPSGLMTVPTKYELDHPGDFSDYPIAPGVFGPVLPPQALDPVGLKLFQLYPEPNIPGAGFVNNYASSPVRRQTSTTIDVRIDHNFSSNDSLFGRYSSNPVSSTFPPYFPDKDGLNGVGAGFIANGAFPGTNETLAQGLQLNYRHVFSPNLLMELRTGFTRINIQSFPYHQGTNMGLKLGIANSNYDKFSSAMPSFHFHGSYTDLGDQIAIPILNINNTYQYNGTVTYTKGTHNLRMGAALVRRQLNYMQTFAGQGWFWWFAPAPFSMVGLLTGQPNMIQRQNQLQFQYLRSWEPGAYVQDDWHVKPWLTLNVGVRWDLFTPFTEKNNAYSTFDIETLKMVVASDDNPTAGIKTFYKNFAPRFGFAAQLGKGMVLRGGYGISYFPGDYASIINQYNIPFNPPAFNCIVGPPPPIGCPAGIGTLAQGVPIPVLGNADNLSGSLNAKEKNFRPSYLQQFNLILQKQFGDNVVTAGFAGSLGRRMNKQQTNINLPDPSTGVPNPLLYAAQLPAVNAINYTENGYNSSYSSMQLGFQRRYSKGLTLNVNYTWAHGLGSMQSQTSALTGLLRGNREYDYGNADLDIRQRFALSLNYDLPFGKSLKGTAGALINGWAINSIASWQTGRVFTVRDAAFNPAPINLPGVTADRPDKVPGQPYVVDNWTITNYINLKAFKVQAKGIPGTESNNQLTGPPTRSLDLSIFKNFSIRESIKLQFRAEAYNFTNTANFSEPVTEFVAVDANGNPTNAGSFGQIIATRIGSTPRQLQFALKLLF